LLKINDSGLPAEPEARDSQIFSRLPRVEGRLNP